MKEEVTLDIGTQQSLDSTLRDAEIIINSALEKDISEEELYNTKAALENGLVVLRSLEDVVRK